jgi:hypothetical protein
VRNPTGGLARRAGYEKELSKAYPQVPRLWLDSGNFFDNPSAAGDIKSVALVTAMERLGYAAVGIGEHDLALDAEHYESLTAEATFARLSGNLVRASSGEPRWTPTTVVESAGRRIGLLSLTRFNPAFVRSLPDGDTLLVESPLEAARRLVPRLREEAELVVLLANMPMDDARLLVRQVEGIDLVLGTWDGTLSGGIPVREGGTTLIYAGQLGQHLAEVRLHFREGRQPDVELFMHTLDRFYPEDEAMSAEVRATLRAVNQEHRRQAERRRRAAEEAPPAEAATGSELTYRGVEICADCHPAAVERWRQSAHAGAFRILQNQDADFNPECVGCHVVGSGQPGGFVDSLSTPELQDVQCEACHGPARDHPEDPSLTLQPVRISDCTVCHDAENSPEFNYYSYWPRIRHGLD